MESGLLCARREVQRFATRVRKGVSFRRFLCNRGRPGKEIEGLSELTVNRSLVYLEGDATMQKVLDKDGNTQSLLRITQRKISMLNSLGIKLRIFSLKQGISRFWKRGILNLEAKGKLKAEERLKAKGKLNPKLKDNLSHTRMMFKVSW